MGFEPLGNEPTDMRKTIELLTSFGIEIEIINLEIWFGKKRECKECAALLAPPATFSFDTKGKFVSCDFVR